MNKNCNKIMNDFLAMDKGERLSINMTMHLLSCNKCRMQVRAMTQAQNITIKAIKQEANMVKLDTNYILQKSNIIHTNTTSPIKISNWVTSGVLMIILMLSFTLITMTNCASGLMVAFYLMFALAITIYCAMFVGCNMDFFIKKIDTHKTI